VKAAAAQAAVRGDYRRAARLDAAVARLREFRYALAPPTVEDLRGDIAEEDRDWDCIGTQFLRAQEEQRAALVERQRRERAECEVKWQTSLALEKVRKTEQGLAIEKNFSAAASLKEKADLMQTRLAMQALAAQQRGEMDGFEHGRQQGIAFIEAEREKAKAGIERRIRRREKQEGKRVSVRKIDLSGWKERTFHNFDGLGIRRYCAEKRSKTHIASMRARYR
jgi:hypothetical protein